MRKLSSWILMAESVIIFFLAIYIIALGITHDKEWAPYFGILGFSFTGSLGLYALSRGIAREKRWAYAPAILANLIALGVAKYQLEASLYWAAIPIVILALTATVTLVISIRGTNN